MKKLLMIAVAALVSAASAEYTSQTIGVTKVTTTNQNTILAVPFASLNGGGLISANELVCTNGLPIGTGSSTTQLHVFKNNEYYTWELDGVSGWVPVASSSHITEAVESNSIMASGGAIWIVLPSVPVPSQDIYIYGDFTTPCTSSTLVSAKDNLVANPLQTKATIGVEPAVGDVLTVTKDGVADKYEFKQNKAKTSSGWRKDGASASLPQIEVGQGIWYKRAGADTTITWTAVGS